MKENIILKVGTTKLEIVPPSLQKIDSVVTVIPKNQLAKSDKTQ